MKGNAGKVPSLAAWSLYWPRGLVGVFKALVYLKLFEQPTTGKGFNRGRREATYSEGKLLQWGVPIRRFFQYQDRTSCQGQFTGEEQAHRSCAGNDHIINRIRLFALKCSVHIPKIYRPVGLFK